VGRKDKQDRDKGKGRAKRDTRQVAVRFPVELADRLETAAADLGLDVSNLLRLMVTQKLPEYEELGAAAQARLRGAAPLPRLRADGEAGEEVTRPAREGRP
jgi:predicted DNA-binding protein